MLKIFKGHKKPKKALLSDIDTEEVSVVDLAANKKKFLFHKRNGKGKIEKLAPIKVEFESDRTAAGTKVLVNGEEIKDVKSFWLDLGTDNSDPTKVWISCTYSKVVESDDGFERTETFTLSKGVQTMKKKTLGLLTEVLGGDDVEISKSTDDNLDNALSVVTKYQGDFPSDLKAAVVVLTKNAAFSFLPETEGDEKGEITKAGKKLSQANVDKLRGIIAAVDTMRNLIPEEEEAEGVKKSIQKLTKSISEIEKSLKGETKPDKEESDALASIAKSLEGITERLSVVEKSTGFKKSVDGQEDENNDGEGKAVKWKSFAQSEED